MRHPDADDASFLPVLQRQIHPDLVGEGATEMAVLLNKAYATLSDDAAREASRYRNTSDGRCRRPLHPLFVLSHPSSSVTIIPCAKDITPPIGLMIP